MKAYSLDLREHIALACAQPNRTIGAVAAQFSVSVSFVAKLLQRQRISGSLAGVAPPQRPTAVFRRPGAGPIRRLCAPAARCHARRVVRLVGGHRWPKREPGYTGSSGTGAGLAAKKKSVHAAERDTDRVRVLRAAFVEAVQAEDFTCFITCFKFVDETSTNLTYCRRYARAEGGQRADQATPLHGGPNMTLVAVLTPDGLQAAMKVSGAVNGDIFAAYLEQVLGPTLVPGDIVVLDNLPAHKVAGLAELVEACGARLVYLSPY